MLKLRQQLCKMSSSAKWAIHSVQCLLLPAERPGLEEHLSVWNSVCVCTSSTANHSASITFLASDWLVWRHVPVKGINHTLLFVAAHLSTCDRKEKSVTSHPAVSTFKLFTLMKMTFDSIANWIWLNDCGSCTLTTVISRSSSLYTTVLHSTLLCFTVQNCAS